MRMAATALGEPRQFQQAVETTTIRSFDGGWNVVDSELNMESKYAVVLENMERSLDGTLSVRPGTRLFCEIPNAADILNCVYFNGQVIVVQSDGVIWSVS